MDSKNQLSIVKGTKYSLHPKLLHKIFEEQIGEGIGDKTALIFHDGKDNLETTYKELNSSSNRMASGLLEQIKGKNLKPNSDGDWIICVCMKPSDKLISVLLSIWKCGGKFYANCESLNNIFALFSCISSTGC